MKLSFECYDVYDNPLPKEEREVVSLFNCETQYTLGVWIKPDPYTNTIVPVYLTEAQFTQLKEEYNENAV